MKVLVTGAFGNIGESTVRELLEQGQTVTTFDLNSRTNRGKARKFRERITSFWGDIRNRADLEKAVAEQEAVIHLAAIIPPLANLRPDLSYAVNVGGTANLIELLKAQPHPPKLIYTSSVAIYGNCNHPEVPLKVSSPLHPDEPYSEQKLECEKLVQASGLEWTILRLSAVEPLNLTLDKQQVALMFEVSMCNRIEFVHTRDVGLALANGASCPQASGKILLVGGGPNCQMYIRDYIGNSLEALGIGRLPEEAFTRKPFHTDWFDTSESQNLLHYQRYTHRDYLEDLRKRLGFRRYLARFFSPLIRRWLLRYSPYYHRARLRLDRGLS